MREPTYEYVCIDADGKKFATYGNFKIGWNHPAARYNLVETKDAYPYYRIVDGFGYRKNVSDARLPKKFKVIFQKEVNA